MSPELLAPRTAREEGRGCKMSQKQSQTARQKTGPVPNNGKKTGPVPIYLT